MFAWLVALALSACLSLSALPASATPGSTHMLCTGDDIAPAEFAIASDGRIFGFCPSSSAIVVTVSNDSGASFEEHSEIPTEPYVRYVSALASRTGRDRLVVAYVEPGSGSAEDVLKVARLDLVGAVPGWTMNTLDSGYGIDWVDLASDSELHGNFYLYLSYIKTTSHSSPDFLRFARSTDRGNSWESPYTVDQSVPGETDFFTPTLAFGYDDYLHLAMSINDRASGRRLTIHRKIPDRADPSGTFGGPTLLNDQPFSSLSIAADPYSPSVWIAHSDDETGFVRTSDDFGQTWTNDVTSLQLESTRVGLGASAGEAALGLFDRHSGRLELWSLEDEAWGLVRSCVLDVVSQPFTSHLDVEFHPQRQERQGWATAYSYEPQFAEPRAFLLAGWYKGPPVSSVPRTITVAPDSGEDYATIQAAIDAAVDGSLILLRDGIFHGEGNRDIDFQGKSVRLQSESGDASTCVIDLDGSESAPASGLRFLSGEDESTVVQNITIRNGWTNGDGGAIRIRGGATPTLRGLRLENNKGTEGVAVDADQMSRFALSDCIITDNAGDTIVQTSEVGQSEDSGVDELHIFRTTFTNNSGVCLYNIADRGDCLIEDCSFIDNDQGFQFGEWNAQYLVLGSSFQGNDLGGQWFGGDFGVPSARSAGSLEIRDCQFLNNRRALDLGNGVTRIHESAFRENAPDGAVRASGENLLLVEDCEFEGNHSTANGGALNLQGDGDATARRTHFLGNQSDADGGAVYDDLTFGFSAEACVFVGNGATDGGAIYHGGLSWGTNAIETSLFQSNTASARGGALFDTEAVCVVRTCTFVDNTSPAGSHIWSEYQLDLQQCILAFGNGGAGLDCSSYLYPHFLPNIECTDIFGNEGGDWEHECLADFLGTAGNISEDPLFCDAGNGDYSLDVSSPCLAENNDCGVMGNEPISGCGAGVSGRARILSKEEARVAANQTSVIPETWTLGVRPNPSHGDTRVALAIPTPGPIDVAIFDVRGRRIRSLSRETVAEPGLLEWRWDGRDDSGVRVRGGLYFCRVITVGGELTSRVTILAGP